MCIFAKRFIHNMKDFDSFLAENHLTGSGVYRITAENSKNVGLFFREMNFRIKAISDTDC